MAIKKQPSRSDFALRLIVDGQEIRKIDRAPDPTTISGQAVFNAGYKKLLDNPSTRYSALENAGRAEAMSTLLGAQDRLFERMLHRRSVSRDEPA